MNPEERFIHEVLSTVPPGAIRAQIEMDLRAHLAERVEHGQSIDDAIRQFGDPTVLAESYLAAVPLVSATFGARAIAKLVDVVAVFVAVVAVFLVARWALGPGGLALIEPGQERLLFLGTCIVAGLLLLPAYFVIAEFYTGQTLGKRAFDMRVVRESGARVTMGQALLRQLPLVGSFFLLDVLFALFTDKSQRAFELISKTRVVRIESETT